MLITKPRLRQFLHAASGVVMLATLTACMETTPPAPANTHPVSQHDDRYQQMLAKLNRKDPVNNAQSALRSGNRFFLCHAGRSNTVPGIAPEVYQQVRANCPTKCLEGVTDALQGTSHGQYISAALAYSATWNQTMLSACR